MTNEKKVMVFLFPGECTRGPLYFIDRLDPPIGTEVRISEGCQLVFESVGEVVREEVRERQLEVGPFDSVFADPEALEERLVVDPPEIVGRLTVCLSAVSDQAERSVEVALDLIESKGA